MKWLDAVKTFGPMIVSVLKPNLLPLVTELIQGIVAAETKGGSSSDKLQTALGSLDTSTLQNVTLADIVPVVSAVVQVSNALSK